MDFNREFLELGITEKEIKSAWSRIFARHKDISSSRGIACTECEYVVPQKSFKAFYAHLTEKHFDILAEGQGQWINRLFKIVFNKKTI